MCSDKKSWSSSVFKSISALTIWYELFRYSLLDCVYIWYAVRLMLSELVSWTLIYFSDDHSKPNPVSKMLLILGSAQRCCLHCRFGYSGQETQWTPCSIHCGCCDHGFGSRGYSLYISKPCWTQTLTLYEYSRVRCRFPISEETQTLVSVAKYASMVLILMWFFKQPKDVKLHNRMFLVTFKTRDS